MAIDKTLSYPEALPDPGITGLDDEAFGFAPMVEQNGNTVELPDGSVEVTVGPPEAASTANVEFGANLASHMDATDLHKLSTDLVELVEADLGSRKDWERSYTSGLEYLGMKIEERSEPWKGASGVYHPLMTEAVVRFQAQTMTEVFPASGPAKCTIIGIQTPERVTQAKRVEQEMNYLLTEKMTEFRSETEALLFRLPLAGAAFKKVYFDRDRGRPVSVFVPAEDFIIQYGSSDLESSERFTHRMKKTHNEIKKLIASGLYRDIDLSKAVPETTQVEDSHNKLIGETPSLTGDDRHTLYEVHVHIDLPGPFSDPDGIGRPHVITIDKQSGKVLAVYRNWDEKDPSKTSLMHFAHYPYMPGMGFYGMGLVHLMGGLAKSATSILRQLIDAGTLSNLPGGLKTRGLRIKGDDTPINPGEWRDVDISGSKLSDALFPLPYKEPSLVLYQLLQEVIEEGRRIGSISDIQVGEMSQNTPVGTTLALLERSLKVMSAVQARVHWGLKSELKIISRLVRDYMPPQYDFDVGGQFNRAEDLDDRVDVVPVSDPNASTMSQRVVKMQAAMELAARNPELYNMKILHRQAMEALDVSGIDQIIPMEEDPPPMDPVSENGAIIMMRPVKVYAYQDHDAHISTHMAGVNDPKIMEMMQSSPAAQAIMGAMDAHLREHLAFSYRKQVEKMLGAELPDPSVPIPEEADAPLSRALAEAADRVKQLNIHEMGQKKALEAAEDPLVKIELAKLDIQKRKQDLEEDKFEFEKLEKSDAHDIDREKIDSKDTSTAIQVVGNLVGQKLTAEAKAEESALNRQAQARNQDNKEGNRMITEAMKSGAAKRKNNGST